MNEVDLLQYSVDFFFSQRKDVTLLVTSNKNCLKPAAASDSIKAITKKL